MTPAPRPALPTHPAASSQLAIQTSLCRSINVDDMRVRLWAGGGGGGGGLWGRRCCLTLLACCLPAATSTTTTLLSAPQSIRWKRSRRATTWPSKRSWCPGTRPTGGVSERRRGVACCPACCHILGHPASTPHSLPPLLHSLNLADNAGYDPFVLELDMKPFGALHPKISLQASSWRRSSAVHRRLLSAAVMAAAWRCLPAGLCLPACLPRLPAEPPPPPLPTTTRRATSATACPSSTARSRPSSSRRRPTPRAPRSCSTSCASSATTARACC